MIIKDKSYYISRRTEMRKLRKPPYSWTLEMIGRKFHVSRARVQQIIGKSSRYDDGKAGTK